MRLHASNSAAPQLKRTQFGVCGSRAHGMRCWANRLAGELAIARQAEADAATRSGVARAAARVEGR